LSTYLQKKVNYTKCLIIISGDVLKDDKSSSKEDSHRLSPAAIAGIVCGSIFVVIVAAVIIRSLTVNRAVAHEHPLHPAYNPEFGRRHELMR